ncbi:hypothetical protein IGI04_015302 [Brassica rapa subsp. trilocularis]|uniref:Mediator of RNA polymerase II transcription subunit 21 n=3 Tax=Brassica TaxID=3705 RepID=A0A816STM1_BRANA|nr:hypothetical protein IGI04_015302 [Brassica rapa subsp. trilocularis]CAF2089485.1 unnamed protein product [Brassica napus]CAG7872339.1 unnamed protein product [Brassica rapa]VDC68194.1 unnamed protein product [Brassica rapa]
MAARIEKLLRDVDGLYWIRAHWYMILFSTPQRDAPPVQLSPKYPDPPPSAPTTTATNDPTAAFREQPKKLRADFVKAAKQVENDVTGQELQKQFEAAVVKAVIEVMNLISTHRASLAVAHGNG